MANVNGYKLYIPQADKISATAEFYIAAQEMPPSYKLNYGPMQPSFEIQKGSGRNSSWKPIRLRDVLSFEADVMYSLYVVYQDPLAVAKELTRGDPDTYGTDTYGTSRAMRRIKDALPGYKASKSEVVDFNTLTVGGLYDLMQNAPKRYDWRPDIQMVVKGIDGVCEFSPSSKSCIGGMTRDGVYMGELRVEGKSSKSVYLTTRGFVLK